MKYVINKNMSTYNFVGTLVFLILDKKIFKTNLEVSDLIYNSFNI